MESVWSLHVPWLAVRNNGMGLWDHRYFQETFSGLLGALKKLRVPSNPGKDNEKESKSKGKFVMALSEM